MSTAFRQHIEKIVPLTDEEFDLVLSHMVPKKLKRHQFLVQQGTAVEEEYYVLQGLLKAYFTNETGKEHIIQFALEDWWISDYQALVNRTEAILAIDCLEDVSLLGLSQTNKKTLCERVPKMEHFFRVKTTSGYVALQQRILSLLTSDAETRYLQLLAQYPILFQRVPKTLIASYLGVSRETLSRLSK